jgi:CBS domain-containing protein
MSENLNLELDFVESAEQSSSAGSRAAARVYVASACCYLKDGGAPTITRDCASFADFEREIGRLKAECDAILQDARLRFGESASAEPGESPRAGARERSAASASGPSAGKVPLKLEQDLKVEDRMTRSVRTLHPNDKLSLADELMKIGNFRHVVVVTDDSHEVVGVVSHRDIFYGALSWSVGQGAAAHQRVLDALPVKNVMASAVTTIAPDTSLADAARTMLEGRVGCLPVVKDERLVGILTEGDFLSMLTEAKPG